MELKHAQIVLKCANEKLAAGNPTEALALYQVVQHILDEIVGL